MEGQNMDAQILMLSTILMLCDRLGNKRFVFLETKSTSDRRVSINTRFWPRRTIPSCINLRQSCEEKVLCVCEVMHCSAVCRYVTLTLVRRYQHETNR